MAETADRPELNSGRFGSIRKSELADSAGVAGNSNRTRCRLEIETAWSVRECWVPIVEQEIIGGQPARQAIPRAQTRCLGTIRKSELIDLARVARNFNCTRCRLEIVRRNTEYGCGKYVGEVKVRIGEMPGMVRPAAAERVSRRMCVLCGLRFSAGWMLPQDKHRVKVRVGTGGLGTDDGRTRAGRRRRVLQRCCATRHYRSFAGWVGWSGSVPRCD
jgi:hypothetical protein